MALVRAGVGAIAQRRPAEDELPGSEREYRALFESAPDAVLIVDPEEGVVLDANRRCADVYGYTRAEMVGLALRQVWPAADATILRQAAQGQAKSFEAAHRRRDGSEIVVDVAAGPVELRGRPAAW